MAPPQERGEDDPSLHDTGEFLAVSGGDGDYTGVRMTDGSPAASSYAEVEPVAEGEQFPSKNLAWGD